MINIGSNDMSQNFVDFMRKQEKTGYNKYIIVNISLVPELLETCNL